MSSRLLASYLPHHRARLIHGGKEYFDILDRLIGEAKFSIHIQFYIFDSDSTGMRVANALKAAALRGVKVYMLIDGYASQSLSNEFIEELRATGIYFQWFEPLMKSKHFYFGRRLHHKVVVFDTARALVAGLNVSDRYNDTPGERAWLDWGIFVEGDVAAVLQKICNRRIRSRFRHPNGLDKTNGCDLEFHAKDALVRVRENDWVRRKREITRSYLEMLTHASSHIIIMSPYFLPGNEVRRRIKLAAKRGIKITVILAGISDIALSKFAERFMYRWLFRNSVTIYEYQKSVLHGKVAVCDGEWVTIGSYNVNNLSAYASVELNLDVRHKAFAQHTENELLAIIKNDCEAITKEKYYQQSTFVKRTLQRFSYNIFRVGLYLFTFYFKQRE